MVRKDVVGRRVWLLSESVSSVLRERILSQEMSLAISETRSSLGALRVVVGVATEVVAVDDQHKTLFAILCKRAGWVNGVLSVKPLEGHVMQKDEFIFLPTSEITMTSQLPKALRYWQVGRGGSH